MKVTIQGSSPKITNLEIEHAAQWYLNMLLTPRIVSKLDITIRFTPGTIVQSTFKGQLHRVKAATTCKDNKRHPRRIELYIKPNQSRSNILSSLAHESVHIKQLAKNELSPDCNYWQKKLIDYDNVNYYDLPHEIEAYGREVGLFQRYTLMFPNPLSSQDNPIR